MYGYLTSGGRGKYFRVSLKEKLSVDPTVTEIEKHNWLLHAALRYLLNIDMQSTLCTWLLYWQTCSLVFPFSLMYKCPYPCLLRDNGRKAELQLLNTFKRKATHVFFCVTDASYFFSPCFCALSKTLSLQLHNSGNFFQVIILSTPLQAEFPCNLLILKLMCFSDRNVNS